MRVDNSRIKRAAKTASDGATWQRQQIGMFAAGRSGH